MLEILQILFTALAYCTKYTHKTPVSSEFDGQVGMAAFWMNTI